MGRMVPFDNPIRKNSGLDEATLPLSQIFINLHLSRDLKATLQER